MGLFFNSGQQCVAGSRLYAPADRSTMRSSRRSRTSPTRWNSVRHLIRNVHLGPLISEEQRTRVLDYMNSGVSDGAELLMGGTSPDSPGYFVEPTILCGHDPRHEGRAGGDLRPGPRRRCPTRDWTSRRDGQRHRVRPGGERLDQNISKALEVIESRQGGDGLGQHPRRARLEHAFRRVQAVRRGPRARQCRDRNLHRDQVGVHRLLRHARRDELDDQLRSTRLCETEPWRNTPPGCRWVTPVVLPNER